MLATAGREEPLVVRITPLVGRRTFARAVIGATLIASLAVTAMPVAAGDPDDVVLPVTHQKLSPLDPISVDGFTPGGTGTRKLASCTTDTSTAANVNTDCGPAAPHNETSIAANPTDPSNIIGGANDYQLALAPGGVVYETIYSRAHVSTDGGHTWTDVPLTNQNAYTSTGDPAVAFDAAGRAYYATLGFTWSQNRACCTNPDVVVETSTDGGLHWGNQARVAAGTGYFTSPGTFNDKEYIAAWGDGNAIVTWTRFNDGQFGGYISSPIYASVTHDGGATWTKGREISGSAAFCVGADGTSTKCNQDQFSTPAVAADGSIYVSFLNYSNSSDGRDQYLVVKVDGDTGQRAAGPWRVGTIYDGFTDYPIANGRQTLQDSQFRTNPAGNLSADPTDSNHLSVVWSDMRNGPATDPDPYIATTNSDVIVADSTDGGLTWSVNALTRTNDQFQPWSAYDTDGNLRIGTFDRSYDADNHEYGYSLWTEGGGWSQLTTTLSDPTQGDRWFSGVSPNADFPHPSSFIGDYSGIAANGSDVVALWTDMRVDTFFPNRTGHGEDAFFAAAP
jgi:hypothetical protein